MTTLTTATSATDGTRALLLRVTLSLLLLTLLGNLGVLATSAAFAGATSNPGNVFEAGTVTIRDNDADGAVLSMANIKPADSQAGCIKVTYDGSLPASVRLYGTTGGTGLDEFLTLKVTRGRFTTTPSFNSCANFEADATDYLGQGSGVIYAGTLRGFADDHASGIRDPHVDAAATWTDGEAHVYRFEVTLQDNDAAQGLTATQRFTWEARSK